MAEANDGLLLLRPSRVEPERTVIVTGLARSGTSMVAALLHAAGLPLGTELDAVVREDREIARNLGQPGLAPVVAARNAAHAVWGFKRPNLHAFGPDFVSAFRHPRVIVTCRDAVALGRRSMLSEHHQDGFAAREAEAAALEGLALLRFASALPCPVLLVSYEKAVQAPLRLARALLGFTGLAADAAVVAQAVQADHPDYLIQTERRFHGFIDGIQGDVMHGWAADPTSPRAAHPRTAGRRRRPRCVPGGPVPAGFGGARHRHRPSWIQADLAGRPAPHGQAGRPGGGADA